MHKKGKLNRKKITNGFKKQDNICGPFHKTPADTFSNREEARTSCYKIIIIYQHVAC